MSDTHRTAKQVLSDFAYLTEKLSDDELRKFLLIKLVPEAKALLARPEPEESLTSLEINNLPERTRHFVHMLETRCDPAGDVRRAIEAQEQVAALTKMIEEERSSTAEPKPRTTREEAIELLDKYCGASLDQWHRPSEDGLYKQASAFEACLAEMLRSEAAPTARPLSEYNEAHGFVVWWKFPIEEPSWIGSPTDSDWPGYHTHWTPHPAIPSPPAASDGEQA